MPYQLILSTDTLDQGRIKINDFFQNSSAGIWSAATPNWSIISLAGPSNVNKSIGNYGFVAGKNNSGVTGNYTSIAGGLKNSTQSSFNTTSNGYNNKIYSSSNYSSVLNGRNGKITGAHSSIVGGNTNRVISGPYGTVVNGKNNSTKFSYSAVLNGNFCSSQGKNSSVFNGIDNTIYMTSNSSGKAFNTIINGQGNFIHAPSSNSSFNTQVGLYNTSKNSSHIFQVGSYNYSSSKLFQFQFGKYITGVNNYEAQFANGAQKIRFKFGASTQAYLTTGGAWQNSGADYGEYFEWRDNNINKEIRTGYFVQIKEGKIIIANSENVVGIVSDSTAFIGDSHQDNWSEIHIKNEWGKIITEKFEVFEFDNLEENNNKQEKIKIYFNEENIQYLKLPNSNLPQGKITNSYSKDKGVYLETIENNKINPNYDPNNKYIPRKDRPEWDVIGLLGKLRVRTSEQITGNYVDVDINTGMAKNGTKYPVMKKIKDFDGNYGIVLIFFK